MCGWQMAASHSRIIMQLIKRMVWGRGYRYLLLEGIVEFFLDNGLRRRKRCV
jgi:hypothetical protein